MLNPGITEDFADFFRVAGCQEDQIDLSLCPLHQAFQFLKADEVAPTVFVLKDEVLNVVYLSAVAGYVQHLDFLLQRVDEGLFCRGASTVVDVLVRCAHDLLNIAGFSLEV